MSGRLTELYARAGLECRDGHWYMPGTNKCLHTLVMSRNKQLVDCLRDTLRAIIAPQVEQLVDIGFTNRTSIWFYCDRINIYYEHTFGEFLRGRSDPNSGFAHYSGRIVIMNNHLAAYVDFSDWSGTLAANVPEKYPRYMEMVNAAKEYHAAVARVMFEILPQPIAEAVTEEIALGYVAR